MSIFDNYNNIPESYIPNNMTSMQSTRSIYKLPYEEYNVKNELIGYSWRYGDSVALNFCIEGDVIDSEHNISFDAETYLKQGNKQLLFKLYNFRYEVVYEQTLVPEIEVEILLPHDGSIKLKDNIYFGQLQLKDIDNNINHTLIDTNELKIFIK